MAVNRHFIALAVPAAAAAFAVFITPATAGACTWGSMFGGAVPAENTDIPSQTEFSLWFSPGSTDEAELSLFDENDEELPLQIDHFQVGEGAGKVDHYHIVPESPLDPGSHSLEVTKEHHELSLEYEVVDQSTDPPSTPDEFQWSRLDDPDFQSECYYPTKQWNDVEIQTDQARDDVWHEIRYETSDGEIIASQPSFEHFRHYLNEIASCITVQAVSIDGTRSDPVERCEPDICQVGTEEVSCDPDAPAEGDDTGVDDVGIDDAGSSEPTDAGDDHRGENADESGCGSSSSGTPGDIPLVVIAMCLFLFVRVDPRRRHV